MSVFSSRVTKLLDVPHDPGQNVTIRKLAPRQLEAAQKEQQRSSLADLRNMGGAVFVKELQALKTDTASAAPAVVDPMLMFDRVTLIEKGVVAWSYADAKLTRETFEDLDETTQEWLAREILRLTKPGLFESADDSEAAQKETDATASVA